MEHFWLVHYRTGKEEIVFATWKDYVEYRKSKGARILYSYRWEDKFEEYYFVYDNDKGHYVRKEEYNVD